MYLSFFKIQKMARRRRRYDEANDDEFTLSEQNNLLFGGSYQTVFFWLAAIVGIMTITVIVIVVPPYNPPAPLGPTTPYPTRLTTATSTKTTTVGPTTSAPTTEPLPPLILTCIEGSVNVPLGFPVATSTFNTTLSGGCPPTTLTFADAIVGTISKRKRLDISTTNSEAFGKSGKFQATPKQVKGIRLGAVQIDEDAPKIRSEQQERSPSFPNGQMVQTGSVIIPNTGAQNPNLNMDVNTNYVVTAVTSSTNSAYIHVYTKALLELGGSPFLLSSLAGVAQPCATGAGQAQVYWDSFANQWYLSEVSADGTTLCLYVSYTQNPLLSLWTLYQFGISSGNASYPQFASFGPSWFFASVQVDSNNATELMFFKRSDLTSHVLVATYYSTASPIEPVVGLNSTSGWTPVTNRGLTQISSIPGVFFIRQRDNSLNPAAPLPIVDYLDILQYFIANNGTLTYNYYSLAMNAFDSSGDEYCIPVPGSTNVLYAGQQWMSSASFNTINALANPSESPYRLYGAFSSSACNTNGGQLFWFELMWSSNTSTWIVRQQGNTPSFPGTFLWLPSIAQDLYGNMVMTFSNSSATTLGYFPSMSAFSRAADDPLGNMRFVLGQLVWAQGGSPGPIGEGWGWSQKVVADPSSSVGRQFYAIGSYSPTSVNTWEASVGIIRIQGEIIQRIYEGLDVCGQVKHCTFFINVGTV